MALIINLFGAPGAGKSTTRAGVFHQLKLAGVNIEEVPEFAKDLTWEERHFALSCQPYVFAKQLRNMERVIDKVDVVITDSPLLLSAFYLRKYAPDKYPHDFEDFVINQFFKMSGWSYYLRRVKPYNPAGRNQTEIESDKIADELLQFLDEEGIYPTILNGNEVAVEKIADDVLNWL